jgi:hypothetical protein
VIYLSFFARRGCWGAGTDYLFADLLSDRQIADISLSPYLARGIFMDQINPFATSFLNAPVVQQQQGAEITRQLRQAEELRKQNARGDAYENQVENTEEVEAVDDHQTRKEQQAHSDSHEQDDEEDDDTPARLDLTA